MPPAGQRRRLRRPPCHQVGPGQERLVLTFYRVDCRYPPAGLRLVEDVVVHQRADLHQLDGDRGGDNAKGSKTCPTSATARVNAGRRRFPPPATTRRHGVVRSGAPIVQVAASRSATVSRCSASSGDPNRSSGDARMRGRYPTGNMAEKPTCFRRPGARRLRLSIEKPSGEQTAWHSVLVEIVKVPDAEPILVRATAEESTTSDRFEDDGLRRREQLSGGTGQGRGRDKCVPWSEISICACRTRSSRHRRRRRRARLHLALVHVAPGPPRGVPGSLQRSRRLRVRWRQR